MKTIIIDGVEYDLTPKTLFKKGDWITNDRYVKLIVGINSDFPFYMFEDGTSKRIKDIDKKYHLWTIQDAKDGDVLSKEDVILIFKCFEEPSYRQHIIAHVGLDICGNIQITDGPWNLGLDGAHPATKEQRDLLFAKMKGAGYEWNAEKKELKKIEQNPIWNEENSCYFDDICEILINLINSPTSNVNKDAVQKDLNWLMSVKELQLKSTWSEEDEACYNSIIEHLKYAITNGKPETYKSGRLTDWLKTIKDRYIWKPNDEQMKGIEYAIKTLQHQLNIGDKRLDSLYQDLKKLREE